MNTMNNPSNNTALELRKCSYNPAEDQILVSYKENPCADDYEKYLEVKYRVFWFRKYCEEKGIHGVIDESEVHIFENLNLVSVTARIIMDGELVAAATASDILINDNLSHNSKIIQNAATSAKGRALADAGFGTVAASIPSESGELYPVDAGITLMKDPTNPLLFNRVVKKPNPEAKGNYTRDCQDNTDMKKPDDTDGDRVPDAISSEKEQLEMIQNEAGKEDTSLQDAYKYIIPIGTHKGESIADVMATDPSMIRWFASDKFKSADRYAELKMAAVAVITEADRKMQNI